MELLELSGHGLNQGGHGVLEMRINRRKGRSSRKLLLKFWVESLRRWRCREWRSGRWRRRDFWRSVYMRRNVVGVFAHCGERWWARCESGCRSVEELLDLVFVRGG